MFNLKSKFTLGAVASVLMTFGAQTKAAFVLNLEQVGNNVVASGVGTLNISSLTLNSTGSDDARIWPSFATFVAGPAAETPAQRYIQLSGPANFGSGGSYPAMVGSGDLVGIVTGNLEVPSGYVSGSPLSDSNTYPGITLSYLGVTPGTYVYTWGSGVTRDTFTINIGTGVPEPASLALLGVPAALALLRRRRRHLV